MKHRLRLIILITILLLIAVLALFGKNTKEELVRQLYLQNPNYNCGKDGVCTTCVYEGKNCKCSTFECQCGEKVVPKNICMLFSK